MDEICADYRKLASIGLHHDQIKDCMVALWAYTYQEIEAAGMIVSSGKNYWVDGINSATPQDRDAVRPDMVNSPPHYTKGGIETIDFIQAKLSPEEYRGYLRGNLLKYASRMGAKGEDDAGKAAWYAQRLELL